MTIVLNCPGCKKRYELDGALAGKKSRCKQCGEIFRIPVPTARMIDPAGPSPAPTQSEAAPLAGLLEGEPIPSWTPRPVAPAPAPRPAAAIPPRARPSALDDSDDEIPRPIRSGFRPARRSSRDRQDDTDLGVTALCWYALISGSAMLAYYAYIGIFEPDHRIAGLVYYGGGLILLIAGYLLCAWGAIWLLVVSFRTELYHGLLSLFVPCYSFFFIVWRWSERRGLFALQVCPLSLYAIHLVMIWVIAISTGDRLSSYPGTFQWDSLETPSAPEPTFRSGPRTVPPIPNWRGPAPRLQPRPEFAQGPRPTPSSTPTPSSRRPDPPDPAIPAGADAITRSLIELKSKDSWKRGQAIERLQRATPDGRVDQVVAALLPILDDDDMFRVCEAEKTLAVWRSPEAMRGLIGRLGDNRHFVRSEAIKALGRYRDAAAAEAIVGVMKEDGFAAEDALKSMGEVAEPALLPVLRSPDPDLRRRACNILAQVGGQATLLEMRSLPADPDLGVRMAAQDAWKRIVARVGPPPRPARAKNSE